MIKPLSIKGIVIERKHLAFRRTIYPSKMNVKFSPLADVHRTNQKVTLEKMDEEEFWKVNRNARNWKCMES